MYFLASEILKNKSILLNLTTAISFLMNQCSRTVIHHIVLNWKWTAKNQASDNSTSQGYWKQF